MDMPTDRLVVANPLAVEHGSPAATPRGQRTLDRLVNAAEKVFTRKGFLETRMSDIAKQAKVAHGTVYTYFDSKEEVFLAVATRAVEDILKRSTIEADQPSDPHASIHAAAESIVDAYREHAAILGSLTIVASFDERASSLRQFLTIELISRADRVIKSFQRARLADADLDRPALATALGAMAESFTYTSVVQQSTLTRDEIVDALAHVWIRSIGLRRSAPRKSRI
jgi:AcrR family transcriptional regulator